MTADRVLIIWCAKTLIIRSEKPKWYEWQRWPMFELLSMIDQAAACTAEQFNEVQILQWFCSVFSTSILHLPSGNILSKFSSVYFWYLPWDRGRFKNQRRNPYAPTPAMCYNLVDIFFANVLSVVVAIQFWNWYIHSKKNWTVPFMVSVDIRDCSRFVPIRHLRIKLRATLNDWPQVTAVEWICFLPIHRSKL